MSSQQDGPSGSNSLPSSYPVSSPSFWTEAAQTALLPASHTHSRSPSPIKDEPIVELPSPTPPAKRARFDADTSLSYLPNRLDPILDDAHAYLANAEYAPNRFGDIGDYMRKKEIKVQTQNRDIALASALEGIPQIFNDLSFYINGNTHPPMEELRKMILQRGGEVRPVLRNKGMVKFIIAPMLTQSKFKQFERYKVVREGWILESCREGRLLDWSRWKLQPIGGWEEGSRKGLEGFLAGMPTQTAVLTKGEDEPDEVVRPPSPIALGSSTQSLLQPVPSNARLSSHGNPQPSRTSAIIRPTSEQDIVFRAPVARPPSPISLGPTTQSLLRPVDATRRAPSGGRQTSKAGPAASGLVAKSERTDANDDSTRTYSPIVRTTASRSRPALASTSIPISPGRAPAESPMKETVPDNVQKPEGGWWEHYYSKEPNKDAPRLLRDQEWRLKNTAERGNEGGFIDGYYQNSRLHHLSTWKAELRVLVAAAQRQSDEQSLSKPSSSSISPFSLATSTLPRAAQFTSTPGERVIFHVDFDCFFVSCGLATRPHLKGKPSVVCHSQVGKGASSTSEIASASYEARAKGVKNGMSLGKARQLVGDDLQTIPYEFDTYKKFSLAFYTVLMGYADELQAVSVDEALIDVTTAVAARAAAPEEAEDAEKEDGDAKKSRDPAVEIAEKIRDEVRGLTEGCEVSIGIAHNVLLAKLGTRRAKPAGVFHVLPAMVPGLLAPLDVEDLPSIGYSIRSKIQDKFDSTVCGDLLEHPKGAFKAVLGPKTGEMLWGYIRGMDDRKLEPHKERKSISAEMNYGIRFQSQEQAEICVADLAAEVSKRMKQVNARGRLLTLKVMSRHPDAPLEPPKFLGHGWCETFNKSAAIGNKGGSATDEASVLASESVKLLRAMRLEPAELRGVGIQITKLDSEKVVEREAGQGTLSFGTKRKREDEGKSRSETPNLQTDTTSAQVNEAVPGAGASGGPGDIDSASSVRVPDMLASIIRTSPPHSSPPLTRRQASLREIEAGPSRPGPSSDGIDPDFLAALPPELRLEVKRDHALSKQAAQAPPPPVKDTSRDRTNTESPSKAKGQHAAAHITRQLRPKVKTQLKAAAVADLPLYGAWAKAQDREETVDLTADDDELICGYRAAELRDLGLDPGVFCELPEDMRAEIIAEERQKFRQRKALHRPADTSRLRAKERDTARTASLSPGRSSRAGSAPPQPHRPLVAVSLAPRPALYKATALQEVLDTVTRWIDSRKGGPPAGKDAGKVKAYLIKCLEPGMGLGAAENAIEVLKWMRAELRDRWPLADYETELDEAGVVWWDTWKGFVDAVNEIAVRRLGAPLRF